MALAPRCRQNKDVVIAGLVPAIPIASTAPAIGFCVGA
jgi:hypothetical protein